MPLKTQRVTITQEGRDKGKTFVITEMPADQAERWFLRALHALLQSNASVSEIDVYAGAAGIARLGLRALSGLPWITLESLLDEMLSCVKFSHNPKHPDQEIKNGANSQIEEVSTRLLLRTLVFELHTGFSVAGEIPTSARENLGTGSSSILSTLLGSLRGWYQRGLQR